MQGMRLAHLATYLGLVALGLYVGIYLPLFHRGGSARRSSVESSPDAGRSRGVDRSELRGVMGHWGSPWPRWLTRKSGNWASSRWRICSALDDQLHHGVRGGRCLTMLPTPRRRQLWPALPVLLVVVLAAAYGRYRLGQEGVVHGTPRTIRVALIQGSIDTSSRTIPIDPDRRSNSTAI